MSKNVFLDPVEGNCIQGSLALKAAPGQVFSLILAAGSDSATATVYDSLSAGGEREIYLAATAGTSACYCPIRPHLFNTGIYAVLTGTAPHLTVAFE